MADERGKTEEELMVEPDVASHVTLVHHQSLQDINSIPGSQHTEARAEETAAFIDMGHDMVKVFILDITIAQPQAKES